MKSHFFLDLLDKELVNVSKDMFKNKKIRQGWFQKFNTIFFIQF